MLRAASCWEDMPCRRIRHQGHDLPYLTGYIPTIWAASQGEDMPCRSYGMLGACPSVPYGLHLDGTGYAPILYGLRPDFLRGTFCFAGYAVARHNITGFNHLCASSGCAINAAPQPHIRGVMAL
jgi:hypothetical protein